MCPAFPVAPPRVGPCRVLFVRQHQPCRREGCETGIIPTTGDKAWRHGGPVPLVHELTSQGTGRLDIRDEVSPLICPLRFVRYGEKMQHMEQRRSGCEMVLKQPEGIHGMAECRPRRLWASEHRLRDTDAEPA